MFYIDYIDDVIVVYHSGTFGDTNTIDVYKCKTVKVVYRLTTKADTKNTVIKLG